MRCQDHPLDDRVWVLTPLPETLRLSKLYLSSVFPDKIGKSIFFVEAKDYKSIDVGNARIFNIGAGSVNSVRS